jgi:hypothetical protein
MKLYYFSSISLLSRQLKEGLQEIDAPVGMALEFHGPLLFESPKFSGAPLPEIRYSLEIPNSRMGSMKWVKTPSGSGYVYIGKEGVLSEWIILVEKLTRNHQYQRISLQELTTILKASASIVEAI